MSTDRIGGISAIQRGGECVGIEPKIEHASRARDVEPSGSASSDHQVGPELESQINIKGDRTEIERFRRLAKRDGYRLIGLLRRAVDAHEREPAGHIDFIAE
ncbi:MAG: hypothetical protein HC834_05340 [Rhodospirillales bacterium]|nr:hypothetical protein [Rhodospirillales bacterium]